MAQVKYCSWNSSTLQTGLTARNLLPMEMEIHQQLTGPDHAEAHRKNILYAYIALFFAVCVTGVTTGSLFDALLLNIGGKDGNKLVGAVESFQGLVQLGVAFPMGFVADKVRRVRLLKMVVPVWTFGLAVVLLGLAMEHVPLMFVGTGLFAACSQTWINAAQVLVSESAFAGEQRTTALSRLASTRLAALATGPALQACVLLLSGENHWGNALLQKVTICGALLWPGLFVTFRMKDVPALEKTSSGASQSGFDQDKMVEKLCKVQRRWWMAGIFELLSLCTLTGAGMTIKFFPLFFRVDYHFTPLELCILDFAYPLCISVMMELCQRLSKRMGRLSAIAFFHFFGALFLWALSYSHPLSLVLPLFLLRGALMNARGPIVRAVVMDLVPSDMRGRWNSIQSMQAFSWSGSAALGGYLVDLAGDYRFTFVVTAGIYSFAFLGYIPIALLWPKRQRSEAARSPSVQNAPGTARPSEVVTPTP
ncbi:unnamed protein product [Effrenium voratum]|nr:unnamed protein product [Effrenium voratum]